MNLVREHFNELLLSALALILTGASIWILAKEGWQAADGFKWASGLVGTVVGALLALLMKTGPNQPTTSKPDAPPTTPATGATSNFSK